MTESQDELIWAEAELRGEAEQAKRDLDAVRKQIAYLLQTSAFYRAKFEDFKPDDLKDISDLKMLPFTEKNELRESLAEYPPLGSHQAASMQDIIQIQATSGTTGTPSFFGLTAADLEVWAEAGARCFVASGLRSSDVVIHAAAMSRGFAGGVPGVRILQHLGASVAPLGAEAGADRLMSAIDQLKATALITGPNFAIHLGEQAPGLLGRSADQLGLRAIVLGGEPGGGVPAIRNRIESLWGCPATEMLGNSDVAPIMWGECREQAGMHWMGQDLVRFELIDPTTEEPIEVKAGVEGELVYTSLRRDASPVARFRSRDRVIVLADGACGCGRTSPRIRCIGRSDDMLIVRGVNVWPAALRDVVASFHPLVTGAMRIVLDFDGHATDRHLRLRVEHREGLTGEELTELERDIRSRVLSLLVVRTEVEMVPPGSIAQPGVGKVALVERMAT